MREVVFDVTHSRGTNPVAALLADHPSARIRTVACHATRESLWRIDRAIGPAVEAGYYETPREIEAYELADRMGVPGSTLTDRLRRAEAWLAKRYVE